MNTSKGAEIGLDGQPTVRGDLTGAPVRGAEARNLNPLGRRLTRRSIACGDGLRNLHHFSLKLVRCFGPSSTLRTSLRRRRSRPLARAGR